MMPIPNVVIIRTFPGKEQGRAIGVFGFCVMLAPAAGPVIGGVLVDHVGWRAVFVMVVPMALAALWFAQRFLPLGRSDDQAPPLDWLGLGAIALAVPLLLNGVIELKGGSGAHPWILLGAGTLLLGGFVAHELRAAAPLLSLRIYARRAMAVGAAVSLVLGFSQAAVTYLLPVYVQHALGYSASRAGLIMLPTLLALGFALPIGGRLADRIASRYLVGGGMLAFGVSTLLVASPAITASFLAITLVTMLGRVGFGILMPSLSLATVRRLPPEEVAHGASMASFMRQFGSSIGVPVAAVFLESRLATSGADVQAAYAHTFAWLALACAFGAVAGWFLEARPPRDAAR
jgi:MFS transporter, DHA2 family, multidrug resistance protein